MHYYKRNLGDYAKKAGRLSMLQHGAYTLLLDACYDREEFPTLEQAIEWTWASTKEEEEAVSFVLRKFFELQGGVYVQKRVQEELAEYHAKSSINKRIATERETKRRESATNRAPDVNEPPPNHEPLTINQEPLTSKPRERASPTGSRLPSDWALPDEWAQWAKEARPDLYIPETAMRFSDYWHSVAGAKGRKADWQATWRNWVRNEKATSKPAQQETFKERDARIGRERWEQMTGQIHPDSPPRPDRNVIDVAAFAVGKPTFLEITQ